ncbi:hypothetical protein EYF80_035791 [Liparis tanakae]|uniref:Uncharacterized protein n=1 Tax=Liparis tanakae TaxID=230148 RepID=A0A4Z2GMJ7_9TELE|nr:hypothetical protein EYF80_035791 [Liparis tanakae]
MLQTDLYEVVCGGEDPKTDGEKDPTLHRAPLVLIVHQLLTDLAVNLIPAHGRNSDEQDSIRVSEELTNEGKKRQENLQDFRTCGSASGLTSGVENGRWCWMLETCIALVIVGQKRLLESLVEVRVAGVALEVKDAEPCFCNTTAADRFFRKDFL